MINLFINDTATCVPDNVRTVAELLRWRQIPEQATAVAVNDRLVIAARWPLTTLADADRITIISAAFGG